jgi:hypothetical protein
MNPLIILGLIVGVPIALLMLLRINATLVFLSLCLGDVLVQFVGNDAHDLLSIAAKHGSKGFNQNYIQLGLLLFPVVLTMVFMIRSIKGAKLVWNVLPAVGVGLVGALLLVPLLPGGSTDTILQSEGWRQLTNAQTLIVIASTFICLLFLWAQRPKHAHESGKHHK